MKVKYIVELSIESSWVADGFDLKTNNDVEAMLQQVLPYAYGHEVGGRIIHKPNASAIKKLQGYKS